MFEKGFAEGAQEGGRLVDLNRKQTNCRILIFGEKFKKIQEETI